MKSAVLALLACVLSFPTLADVCAPAPGATRIAIAGGSITEVVYFLGEEARIVATDRTSNYPDEALEFPSVGYVRSLSAEGILSLKPDLVLGESDMGPDETVTQLRATSVDVRKFPEAHDMEGVLQKVRCVARIFGVEDRAETMIEQRLAGYIGRLNEIAGNPASTEQSVALLLTFTEDSPIVAGRETSGDSVLRMAGVTNTFKNLTGWKPVSLEAMAKADPALIIISARGFGAAGGKAGLQQHPALRFTRAVKNDQVHVIDGMALLGFGPRTLEAAVNVSDIVSDNR